MFQPKTVALLRGLFAKDEDGNVYLRMVDGDPAGGTINAVSSQSNRSLEDLITGAIVLDGNGNPALRILGVDFGSSIEDAEKARRLKMVKAEADRKEALQLSFQKPQAKAEEEE